SHITQQTDLRIEHRNIHVLAAPGEMARIERRKHTDGRHESSGEIAEWDARARGRVAGLTRNAHAAAHRLRNHVERGAVFSRTCFAEAGDRARDDARIDLR